MPDKKRTISVIRVLGGVEVSLPILSSVTIANNGGTLEGSYVYTQAENELENNSVPYINNLSITGNNTVGSTLSLNYDFISPSNYTEGTPSIQWKRVLSTGGSVENIAGGLTHTVTDAGYDIYAELTVNQTAASPANGNPSSTLYTTNSISIIIQLSELAAINLNGSATVAGYTNLTNFTNGTLTNINGNGIDLAVTNAFQSTNSAGAITGDNSGIVPDDVLVTSFRVGSTDNVGEFTFSNFNANQIVEVVLGGSRASGNQLTEVTVNGETKTFDPSQNTTIEITYDVQADVNGDIVISVTTNPINNNGYIGWIRING